MKAWLFRATLAAALPAALASCGHGGALLPSTAQSQPAVSHAAPLLWGTAAQIVGVGASSVPPNTPVVVQYAQCNDKIWVYPNYDPGACGRSLAPPPIEQRRGGTSISTSKAYRDCVFAHGDGSCAFRSSVEAMLGSISASSWVQTHPPSETGKDSGEIGSATGIFQDQVTPAGSPAGGLAKMSTTIAVSIDTTGFSCKAWLAAASGYPTLLTAQATFKTSIGIVDTLKIVGSCPSATSPVALTSYYTYLGSPVQAKTTKGKSLAITEVWSGAAQPVIGQPLPLSVSLSLYPNVVSAYAGQGERQSSIAAKLTFGMKSLERTVKLKTASGTAY